MSTIKPLCAEAAVETVSEKEDLKNDGCFGDPNSEDLDDNFIFGDNPTPKSIVTNHYSFKPIYFIGYWNDPDDNDNPSASVAILTVSGIDKISDFFINIVSGRLLEYKVVWPTSLTVSDQLHAVWIEDKGDRKKLTHYLWMVKCFDSMLSTMRRHNTRVETSAMVPINMKVETQPGFFVAHPKYH